MKTGVICVAVLTVMAAQQVSAAFRSSCFGSRCHFQSSNSVYRGFRPRYSQNQYQGNSYNRRFSRYRPLSSRFGSSPNHLGSSRSQFISSRGQLGSPSGQLGRFSGPGRRQSQLQSRLAGATADQRYRAQLAASRQLSQRRQHEQQLLQSRSSFVRPGTPSAALAAEKRADAKSLALGSRALQQILYLQNLVGSGR